MIARMRWPEVCAEVDSLCGVGIVEEHAQPDPPLDRSSLTKIAGPAVVVLPGSDEEYYARLPLPHVLPPAAAPSSLNTAASLFPPQLRKACPR